MTQCWLMASMHMHINKLPFRCGWQSYVLPIGFLLEQHGITPCWKADFANVVGISSLQGQLIGQGEDDEDTSDRESENESDLDDEEDIRNSFSFKDI